MTTDADAPADTRMMRIVHQALRRDLRRAQLALTASPPATRGQQRAIARHLVAAEPYELVWRTVPTPLYPDSTEWTIRLRPTDGGTQIEQTFTVLRAPKVLDIAYGLVIPAHRDRTAALTEDLRRLGQLAVGSNTATLPTTAADIVDTTVSLSSPATA
jgi:hypothetical protein